MFPPKRPFFPEFPVLQAAFQCALYSQSRLLLSAIGSAFQALEKKLWISHVLEPEFKCWVPGVSLSSSASFQSSISQWVNGPQKNESGETTCLSGDRAQSEGRNKKKQIKSLLWMNWKTLVKTLVLLVSSRMPIIRHLALGLRWKGPWREDQGNNASHHLWPGGR